ncbi:DNA-binding protein [Dyadobacter sp. CY107]|uniref:helix-turn-helix transcriptional regulator n=1 Tax=Dyadobacter fanqingshengii TaxID=2906443 RepID=UPI001F1A0D29|nr:DNA-binding protein [Dyadobacter fanqingshengii]MCF2502583.1 DNA-binding protein [Dyadobacter fanqingshengii]
MDNPFHSIDVRLGSIESTLLKIEKRNDNVLESIPTFEDEFIDQKKVAVLLKVSGVTIWDWEKKGILTSYRIGNLKRFKLSEVMGAPQRIKRGYKGSNSSIVSNV